MAIKQNKYGSVDISIGLQCIAFRSYLFDTSFYILGQRIRSVGRKTKAIVFYLHFTFIDNPRLVVGNRKKNCMNEAGLLPLFEFIYKLVSDN